MEIIKKVKKAYAVLIGNDKESKQEIILNYLIDSIEMRGDTVHIKTKKNILLENDGHIVTINSGMNVILANQIHLNPKINFEELKPKLDEARRIEQIAYEEAQAQILLEQRECSH